MERTQETKQSTWESTHIRGNNFLFIDFSIDKLMSICLKNNFEVDVMMCDNGECVTKESFENIHYFK